MYALHRFSLTHDKFFGAALVDYRFAGYENQGLINCDYCQEKLEQDNLGYCVTCGALGDSIQLPAGDIIKESQVLEELTGTPDVWKMASKKLSIMYFSQLKRQKSGEKVDPVRDRRRDRASAGGCAGGDWVQAVNRQQATDRKTTGKNFM